MISYKKVPGKKSPIKLKNAGNNAKKGQLILKTPMGMAIFKIEMHKKVLGIQNTGLYY